MLKMDTAVQIQNKLSPPAPTSPDLKPSSGCQVEDTEPKWVQDECKIILWLSSYSVSTSPTLYVDQLMYKFAIYLLFANYKPALSMLNA